MRFSTRRMFVLLAPFAGLLMLPESVPAQLDLHETFYGVPASSRRTPGRAGSIFAPPAKSPRVSRATGTTRAEARQSPGRMRMVSTGGGEAATGDEALGIEMHGHAMESVGPHVASGYPGGSCSGCQDGYAAPMPVFGGCGQFGQEYGDCGTCGPAGPCDTCGPCEMDYGCETCGPTMGLHAGYPRNWWLLKDMAVSAGVHGFKGPADQGANGNFGFHEGINFGAPLGALPGVGYQLGLLAVQSDFSGSTLSESDRGDRDQIFFTGGLFHRRCVGLNWGVVFDLMHDVYYYDGEADLKQLRTETSWRFPSGNELGYFGAYGLGTDGISARNWDGYLDPTDMFALFWRRHFSEGGEGRIWAGMTGKGDGLVGADLELLMGRGFSLQNSFTYLIPKEARGSTGLAEESWGVSIQVVWHLGQPARCALESPYRPFMSVADNTKFLADFLDD